MPHLTPLLPLSFPPVLSLCYPSSLACRSYSFPQCPSDFFSSHPFLPSHLGSQASSCLFLHNLTLPEHDGCVGPFSSLLTKTMEVTGPNLDWRRALTSSGVLALYLLFFENSTSMCLFLCVFWKGRFWLKCVVVTEQDGSPITASVHWQVG